MPFASEHMLLQFGGTLGTNPLQEREIWSSGLRINTTAPLATIDLPGVGDALANRLADTFRSDTSGVSDMARLVWVKWNRIGTDGRYVNQGTTREYNVAPAPGGQRPIIYHPWQASLAITLRTAKRRGLASSGRFFLPAPSFQIEGTDGRIPADAAQNVANTWGGFIDSITGDIGPLEAGVYVMSKGRNNGTGPGEQNLVTDVLVGRRIDVIRSRANKIEEGYVGYPLGGF